jgi:lipopolysaccharide/colanic/teichoic acid biosynthesis glycosyltransferase
MSLEWCNAAGRENTRHETFVNFQNDLFPRAEANLGLSNGFLGVSIGRRPLLDRFLIQVPAMLILVLGLQFIVARALEGGPAFSSSTIGTMIATAIANTLSFLIYREFRRTPGTRRLAYILPSFVIPWGALAAVVIGLRLPYSNVLLLVAFTGGFLFAWLVNARRTQSGSRLLYLVPGARSQLLADELPFLETRMLVKPADMDLCGDGMVAADLLDDIPSDWERAIARAALRGIPVYNVKQVQESLTGRVQIESMTENSFGSLVPSLSYLLLKRVVDVVVSAVLLLILAIPLCAIGLAIRATSDGSAIFLHRRVGFRGAVFETMKFRTMRSEPQDSECLEQQMTRENDPRITSIGRFLRKTRIDELPQLINVFRGEMSLIGPRPEALALSRWYDEHLDFYAYRHIVRPGITGWAQVNQGHVTDLDDVYLKLQYDFYYIKNISAWLDILISIKTVFVMMSFRGAK